MQQLTLKNNLLRHVGTKHIGVARLATQLIFTLFCLYSGYRFYLFYLWAVGRSSVYVERPPAVEGFLPISALLSLKRLVLAGTFDAVHPAGLVIFLAALTISFLFRKSFCGWICPVGCTSNLAERMGRRWGILVRLPRWLDYPLLSLKYALLGFFLHAIILGMDIHQITAFQNAPYNIVADAKMLAFFLEPSRLAGSILLFLIIVSFFLRNFWCRYLCPYGALLGLLALGSPLRVRRDPDACIQCGKCERRCPGSIRIASKKTVLANECIGCMECISVCPQKNCLTLSSPGRSAAINVFLLPAAALALFLLFWLTARLTGHWETEVPLQIFKQYYSQMADLAHP